MPRPEATTVNHPLLAPLGLLVVLVVIADAAIGEVGFGLTGQPLALTVVCAVFLVSASTFLLWRRASPGVTAALLTVLAASVVAMHLLDPQGPVLGLLLLAAFAPLRPPHAIATALTIAAALAFNVTQLLVAGETLVLTVATDAAVAFFYLVGTLLRREQQQRERGDRLVAELEASRAAEREAVAEAARGRLARELHDVLAHTLSGLTIQLQAARLLSSRGDASEELARVIDRSHDLARAGVVEAKRAVGALRGEGVPGASDLPALVEEHKLASSCPATLVISGTAVPLSAEQGLTLYRTAQEALTNARKHARGAPVAVTLAWKPEQVVLVVQNGTGPITSEMNPAPRGGRYGLQGMAERARLIGADLTTRSDADGFTVRLSIPLPAAASESEADHGAGQEVVSVHQDGENTRKGQ
ncbi:sensor histidine kinase [Naasia sp. SYSU D00948]|uniref:sensor histidine kinase n=1 Tax=Naasia sp. SYSU D00948 TaxID=2817379 RepID=UPI001B31164E|nr:histidine kinase [Naasia sp. SYSU D00948]